MKLTEKSHTELLELYVELLKHFVEHYEVKAPQAEIDITKRWK